MSFEIYHVFIIHVCMYILTWVYICKYYIQLYSTYILIMKLTNNIIVNRNISILSGPLIMDIGVINLEIILVMY